MTITLIISLILMFISIALSALSLALSKKSDNYEKQTPFECGFDPKSDSRLPFSMRFFLIAIIFLIFDVEVALVLPLVNSLQTIWTLPDMLTAITVVLIIVTGTLYEWQTGALDWKN